MIEDMCVAVAELACVKFQVSWVEKVFTYEYLKSGILSGIELWLWYLCSTLLIPTLWKHNCWS